MANEVVGVVSAILYRNIREAILAFPDRSGESSEGGINVTLVTNWKRFSR